MLELLKKRIKNEKGLSLVELLAVIVILGIVAAIAIPAIGNIIENSRYNAVKADAINVLSGAQIYYTDNPGEAGPVAISVLQSSGYLENAGAFEEVNTATITKVTGGNQITDATVTFSGTKTVKFTNASITLINSDVAKGSEITSGYLVGTTTE